jgi:hypothetical protein
MPVLDRDHFDRQTFGDFGLQKELIALFLGQADEAVRQLALPVTGTAWRFLTHTLKGASSAIGAARFVSWACRWERTAAPDGGTRKALAEELQRETAAFRQAAADFLP